MNIAVIGAGPIGGYAAYLFAKNGHAVDMYEEHAQVGCPIQCTGLLTGDFDQFSLPMQDYLVNTFSIIKVFSPGQQKATIQQKEYLVHRTQFDSFFVDKALKAGARLHLQHSFQRKEGKNIILRNSLKKEDVTITPDIVIAADGPQSKTVKAFGFYHPQRQSFLGIQATVKGNFDQQGYQAYFGEKVCPGLFAWVVPESPTIARVGLGTLKDTKAYFDAFMKEKSYTALEIQAGLIPVYHPQQKVQHENCYALGDAASFVKATTLGGLIPGLKQAEIVVDSIIHKKNLEPELKPLRRQLRLHLKMHHVIQKMKDHDWENLFRYINQPRIQRILEQHTRDNPIPLVLKSLLKEPRLLYFGKYLF